MKKFLTILLSVAFVLNLALVVGIVGECLSPRQAFYTITDEMMNSAYLDFLGDGQVDCPSLFVYWDCAKETKTLMCFYKTTKFHTKNCSVCGAVLQWIKGRMNCA